MIPGDLPEMSEATRAAPWLWLGAPHPQGLVYSKVKVVCVLCKGRWSDLNPRAGPCHSVKGQRDHFG